MTFGSTNTILMMESMKDEQVNHHSYRTRVV